MRDTVLAISFVVLALGAIVLFRPQASDHGPGRGPSYEGGRLDRGDLTVLRLAGTPLEKGRAHGRLLRDDIRDWVDRLWPEDLGVADFVLTPAIISYLPDKKQRTSS